MKDRRALVISYHVPQPDRDSGSRRLYHLIEFLAEAGWEVALLAADGVERARDTHVLQRRGIRVYDGYRHSIEDVIAEESWDLVLVGYWVNAQRFMPQLRALSPATRLVVDSVDLHFVRESRKVLRLSRSATPAVLTDDDGARMAAELNTYAGADAVLTVSQKEADLVNDLVGDPRLARAVPDNEELTQSPLPFAERVGIVCIGSFQHPPNKEAVAFLCRDILPLVDPELLRRHPVLIVGNELNDSVRSLGRGLPYVQMVGWVPEVEPYLERARISVVPLLHGAGTKRKLLQALAIGTPTVATSIGIEGLGLADGADVLVADEPAAFAQAITTLLTNEDTWQRLAEAGRTAVMQTHARETARRLFVESVDAVMADQPKVRSEPREQPSGSVLVDGPSRQGEFLPGQLGRPRLVARAGRGVLSRLYRLRMPLPAGFTNPLFDAAWYLTRYPDVQESGANAFFHYRRHGIGEGRDPNAFFSARWYLENNPDVAVSGLDPLDHYLRFGGMEGRDPSPRFDGAWYLHQNPNVALAGMNPLLHYLRHGMAEGRLPRPQEAITTSVGETKVAADDGEGRAQPPLSETAPAPTAAADVRLVAFYLPQFHPIPENDEWWGEGFTEWRSVASAKPMFPGHYQPHVPGELGFYDLRLAETRQAQADLARAHGIFGFCYYHYWFEGRQLLERPFNEVLASGQPDLPFCLCWANDPWSRRWNGREDDLLMRQSYSARDDLDHIRWLLPALADPRAITVDGRPMFLIYRAKHLEQPARTIDIWREEVHRAGLPGIHLVAIETAWDLGWDATVVGFDAKVLFQPQFGWLMTTAASLGAAIPVAGRPSLQVYEYDTVVQLLRDLEPVPYRRYESVFPGWDNTARVGDRAVVMHNANPESYGRWLAEAVARAQGQPSDHRLVFINAWNEWAEGCHLEPDRRDGRAFLEATRRAVLPALGPDGNGAQQRRRRRVRPSPVSAGALSS